MKANIRYLFIGLGILLILSIAWYFIDIVAYILISAVLALIGRPIVEFLGKIKFKNIILPKALRAFFALMVIWFVFVLFFRIFIPVIVSEVDKLSVIDPQKVLITLDEPIKNLEQIIDKYKISGEGKFTIQDYLSKKVALVFNETFFASIFSYFAGLLGNFFIAIFSITFITYFFLRDEHLFAELVLILVPEKHDKAFKHAMNSARQLLRRYFFGIIGQLTGIFILVTIGLTAVGVGFNRSLLIGLIAALVNVIPYVGPIIGATLGILLGLANHLDMNFYSQLLPLIGLMILVFIIVHLIDNFIVQPLIFSNSVHAHPLEIFLVILIAGSLAGVLGMFLAIPVYTVIRVFAKEFFNNFKVVKKLTKNIQ
jgi:predicted PurR-regulated permease PerM